MTTVEELTKRVNTLEDTVTHLTTHHDEEFVAIHDDVEAVNRCEQLFHVNLQRKRRPMRRTTRASTSKSAASRVAKRKT